MLRGGGEAGGGQASLSQAPFRSGWLGWLPVSALEDNMARFSLLEAEEALEVDSDTEEDVDLLGRYSDLPVVFCCPRHLPAESSKVDTIMQTWRMRERMKTVSVALVICLNVGVDPPDVTKTQPCARLECWVDPLSLNPQRALETIGANLQRQYERWQPRARYRQSPDPTVEEVRRLATGLRRSARDERVLFHYNGHGVPKPTANGEIWVFNRSYTQYIPLSIYNLQTWMGSPSIYVWDCNNAGIIVESFKNFAEQHEREYVEQMRTGASLHPVGDGEDLAPPPSLRNCIHLAACSKDQLLPMNPELAAADLFTSCLTTPIKMALRWFVMTNDLGHLAPEVKLEQLEKIPGQFGDRRTMLGELNWIFTAITDTIAWNTLPRETFQKLFRQDLLVASLFRNFLLAERIMKANDCTPISQPKLPDTHQHQMWTAWDLALDICLSQLQGILEEDKPYVPSSFFEEQLTAFDVWLSHGSEERTPPEQLPIVLQVLLSQAHRLRALDLLGRFLDLGAWAVNLALSVGIFPYVLKLLQSSQRELRPLLVFIWAKILAVDSSCQHDLVRDQSHKYFLTVLQDPAMLVQHKTWSVFVLASVVSNYKQGQDEAVSGQLISICLNELEDTDPVYRQWLVICLAACWDNHEEARGIATRDNAPDKLETLLSDETPEVRAAAVMALGTFINSCRNRREHENTLDQNIAMRLLSNNLEDGSPLVRRELVSAMQWVVNSFLNNFLALLKAIAEEDDQLLNGSGAKNSSGINRISSEDKLGRLVSSNRKSVVGFPSNQMSGSINDLSSSSTVNSLTTPRRGRKSTLTNPGYPSPGNASLYSLATLSSYGPGVTSKFKPFYLKVLGGLMVLERDPDSNVSKLAKTVLDNLYKKLSNSDRKNSYRYRASHNDVHSTSLPGSPSRPSFTLGSSPPVACGHNTTLPNLSMTMSSMAGLSSSDMNDSDVGSNVSTEYMTWASAHFSSHLMRLVDDPEDQESETFWSRQWMYDRNDRTRDRASAERNSLDQGTGKLDESLAIHRTVGSARVVSWESYTSNLYVATRDTVHFYTDTGHVSWSNGNPRVSNISCLATCNSHVSPNLIVGSDDGCARVWTVDESGGRHVTGWVVMPELVPISCSGPRVNCGLQLAWNQHNLTLIAGGDSKNLRIWDCNTEMKVADVPTQLDTCVTSIYTGASDNKHLAAVSFADGHVKLFDTRSRGSVMRVREHKQMVLGVKLQAGSSLISGCGDGVIKVWDIRKQSSLHTWDTGSGIISFDIHATCPLVSMAHSNGQLSLYSTLDGKMVNIVKQQPTRVLSSTTCLRFHPNLLQLAAASSDNTVSVFGYRKY